MTRTLLLLPVQLVNKADPTVRDGGNDTPIQLVTSGSVTSLDSIAWIAASDTTQSQVVTGVYPPRMPELVASSGSIPGLTYCWKLQVIFHDRNGNPHRDFDTGCSYNTNSSPSAVPQDTVTIPATSSSADPNNVSGWHQITDGSPWKIYQNPDWTAAVSQGFFGGDAVLSLKILDSSGNTVTPEQDYKFRIEGENPDPTACKAYIKYMSGYYWWAYAIAKHETKFDGGREYYNEFLDSGSKSSKQKPGKQGRPDWNNDGSKQSPVNGSGGYGLFQLTYAAGESNFIMPRNWIWNWQANTNQGISDINDKYSQAATWVGSQQARTTTLTPNSLLK